MTRGRRARWRGTLTRRRPTASFPSSPLFTLHYLSYSQRGRSAGGERREAIEAGVKNYPPVISLLPFHVDPAQDFNEWIVESLPPARRE